MLDWPGLKVTCCESHRDKPGIKAMERVSNPWGIDPDPRRLRWNTNSGACAINLAVHFGVRRIVLLGFDMQKVDGRKNWHQDYPKEKVKKGEEEYVPYPRMMEAFKVIAEDLRRMGIECLNATKNSAMECFTKVKLEDLLA